MTEETPVPITTATTAVGEAPELRCVEEPGYPCTYDEMTPEVRRLQASYAAHISGLLGAEGREAAHEWIKQQEGVVETHLSQTLLMFRIDGAMPFSIITPIAEPPPDFPWSDGEIEAQSDRGVPVALEIMTTFQPGGANRDVVGEGTDRENPQNKKRALFLEPWAATEGSIFSAGRVEPESLLKDISDYNHADGVVHKQDDEVDPTWFLPQAWRQFDFIYVSTHGGTWPGGGTLETGIREIWDGKEASYQSICDRLIAPYSGITGVSCGEQWPDSQTSYVTIDVDLLFFQHHYGGRGLDKAIVYIEACQSIKWIRTFAPAIVGDTSLYIGWTDFINLTAARHASGHLLTQMTKRGKTAKSALKTVCDNDQCGGPAFKDPTEPTATDPYLELYPVTGEAPNLRLYDIPTFRDPNTPTNILEDGAEVQIEGSAGDGEPDKLDITVDLIGIIDPEDTSGGLTNVVDEGSPADLYNLRFFIGDEERDIGADNLGRAVNPTATTTSLGDNNYRYSFTAELGFDVDPEDNETTLKVVVELPEGGISDYEIDIELVSSAATITVGGQTWDFVLSDFYGVCTEGSAGTFVAGHVDGDINGVGFSADLSPDGGQITVNDPDGDENWMAAADRETMTDLHLVPQGHSQIDQITVDGNRFYGTATFIGTKAFREALFYNTAYPQPVTGSFDIRCG